MKTKTYYYDDYLIYEQQFKRKERMMELYQKML